MTLINSLFGFFIILLSIASCSREPSPVIEFDFSQELVESKQYIVAKANEKMKIDGIEEEAAWENAPFTTNFIDIEGIKKPKFKTNAKMLWDEQFLYVFAYMEEPHIWADIDKRDAVIYYNNDFEVFIDPNGDSHQYAEIEINALGTEWDLLLNRPYRSAGFPNSNWNLPGLKTAVHIEGSLNDPSDIDSFWTVEMAIPMKGLINLKDKPRTLPKDGEQWRLNFSRVEWDFDLKDHQYSRKKVGEKLLPEYNWVWSEQKVINMHEPEKWGYIQFSKESNISDVVFNIDPDQNLKQALYGLYRQIRGGKLKFLLDLSLYKTQKILLVDKEDILNFAHYSKTKMGFEIWSKSDQTGKIIILDQTGLKKESE